LAGNFLHALKIYAKVPLGKGFWQGVMNVTSQSKNPTANKKKGADEFADELYLPIWSVISFDRHEAVGLKYDAAFQKLEELEAQGVAGLCVVTDDAAARIGQN